MKKTELNVFFYDMMLECQLSTGKMLGKWAVRLGWIELARDRVYGIIGAEPSMFCYQC